MIWKINSLLHFLSEIFPCFFCIFYFYTWTKELLTTIVLLQEQFLFINFLSLCLFQCYVYVIKHSDTLSFNECFSFFFCLSMCLQLLNRYQSFAGIPNVWMNLLVNLFIFRLCVQWRQYFCVKASSLFLK